MADTEGVVQPSDTDERSCCQNVQPSDTDERSGCQNLMEWCGGRH